MNELQLQQLISEIRYTDRVLDTTATICMIRVDKFVVVGQTGCLEDQDYDQDLGRQAAYNDALRQLYKLEAYRLKGVPRD